MTMGGLPMPFGILHYEWTSSTIEAQVLKIIVEESVGFHTATLSVPTSSMGYYLISGCVCSTAGCTEPTCGVAPQRWHVALGAWPTYIQEARNYVERAYPALSPLNLGELGYEVGDGLWVMDQSRREAFQALEVPLEYYRHYNTSADLSLFFAKVDDIPQEQLRLCKDDTYLWSREQAEAYLRFTGDVAGVVSSNGSSFHAACHDNHWWLAPRCRSDVARCIPVISGGEGWGLQEWMMKATTHGLPLAIGVASNSSTYRSLPSKFKTLLHWWFPDSAFAHLRPTRLIFPPHNRVEWAAGNKCTSAPTESTMKLAWHDLVARANVGGNALFELTRRVFFAQEHVDHFVAQHERLVVSGALSASEAASRIACDWVQENRAVWSEWTVLPTACAPGQGLTSALDVINGFVPTRQKATSCEWCSPGRFSQQLKDSVGTTFICASCEAGYEQALSGQQACHPCPPGRFKSEKGGFPCKKCPPGHATNLWGQTLCQKCAVGTAAARTGEVTCAPCSEGTSANQSGSHTCTFCHAGTFSNTTGSSTCTTCDDVLPASSTSRGAASSLDCQCPAGTFKHAQLGCVECVEGLQCPGGNDVPLQMAGYWVDVAESNALLAKGGRYSIFRCRNALECTYGTVGSCAHGRVGPACNNCRDRYYPAGDGTCAPCIGGGVLPGTLFGIILIAAVTVIVVGHRIDPTKEHLASVSVAIVAGQAVTAIQAMAAMHKLQIDLPEPLATIMGTVKLFALDFDLLRLPCMFMSDDPVNGFVVKLTVYPFFLLSLLAAALMSKLVRRPLDSTKLKNANGMVLFLAYTSLTLAVMLPFQCRVSPGGFMSMASNPGLKCFADSRHTRLVVLAVLGVLAYPASILSWVIFATMTFKRKMSTESGVRKLQGYRFLFGRFRPECYHFGLLFLVRNGLVATIPAVLVPYPAMQVLLMASILLLGSFLQVRCWPWRTDPANFSDMLLGYLLLMMSFGLGSFTNTGEPQVSAPLGTTLVALLGCALAACVLMLAVGIYQRFQPPKRFGIFLCHHKAGTGALCRLIKVIMPSYSNSPVFLDADQLEDLDLLFDIVRSNVANVAVLLSPQLLSRPWCAGEIVTAHRNSVTIIPLACEGFVCPKDEELGSIIERWSEDEAVRLLSFGVSGPMVIEAYRHLLALPRLEMPSCAPMHIKKCAVWSLAECAGLVTLGSSSMSLSSLSSLSKPWQLLRSPSLLLSEVAATVLVAGNIGDAEALAACEILQCMLKQHLYLAVDVLYNVFEAKGASERGRIFIPVLSRGLLSEKVFAEEVLALFQEGQPVPHVLPVAADPSFQFPAAAFYKKLEEEGLPGIDPSQGRLLSCIYQHILSVLAKPFSPLGSQSCLGEQVKQISARARRLLERDLKVLRNDNKQIMFDRVPTELHVEEEDNDVMSADLAAFTPSAGSDIDWAPVELELSSSEEGEAMCPQPLVCA